jgi:hypothetical protein
MPFCRECGEEIPNRRVQLLPDTGFCVGCQKAEGTLPRFSNENLGALVDPCTELDVSVLIEMSMVP